MFGCGLREYTRPLCHSISGVRKHGKKYAANTDRGRFRSGFQSRQCALCRILHDLRHSCGFPVGVFKRLDKRIEVFRRRLQDGKPPADSSRAKNSAESCHFLFLPHACSLFFQLREDFPHFPGTVREFLHINAESFHSFGGFSLLRIERVKVYAERVQLFRRFFRRPCQAQKSRSQGCSRLARLDAAVRHQSRKCSGFFQRCAKKMRHRRGVFHRFAQHLNICIRVGDGVRENVCHVPRFICAHAESGQVVGDNVRRPCQICSACGGQVQKPRQAADDLLGFPPRHA